MTMEDQGPATSRTGQQQDKEEKKEKTGEESQDTLIPLYGEEANVSKQRVVTGRVNVATVTRQQEQLVEEQLEHDRLEIERTPIGKEVDQAPPVRQEGDTMVIPIVEEVAVVQRRLVLKEEVRIHRTRETQPFQERVVVRKQEAIITRLPDETNRAA